MLVIELFVTMDPHQFGHVVLPLLNCNTVTLKLKLKLQLNEYVTI
jgi:hypothetical protein